MSHKETKQIVGPGKFVAYVYKLYNADSGEILFEVPEKAPDVMVYGVTQDIVPGLAEVLKGLAAGDKFEVTLPPAAAFGERSDDWIKEIDKNVFMTPEGKLVEELVVGAELPMMTDRGFAIRGKVTDITDNKVVMDFNHPFAGMTVRYDGHVDEVRDATEDELNPPQGCCGCGDNCGDGCGENHGDGDCCGGGGCCH